ncbi:HEAT repeat domain-containing protein [Streptomyces sp. NPDC058867]|uniref:HEAT repeat domain-containing protein n=1 Tax=unclassified Streptomyces TaxID=2593676 RepID=UPI00368D2113
MEIDNAPDLADLLGAMESEDALVRDAALEWLVSASWREDDLAAATARAVPELARLARELPDHRAELLVLLSDLADRDDWPDATAPARREVAAELPSLLPFAEDPDPAVRDAVLPLLVACRHRGAVPLLRDRLARESDPAVRGHTVTALALLEPDRSGWRRALLTDPAPGIRLAAAEDLLRTAEPPFPDDLVDVCAQAYAADPHELDEAYWAPAPHRRFTERLLDDPDAAVRATAGGVPLAFEVTGRWRDRETDVLPYALRDLEKGDGDLYALARLTCALPAELRAPVRDRVRPRLDGDLDERAAAITVLARAHAPEAIEETIRLVDGAPGPSGGYGLTRAVHAVADAFGADALPVARAVARRIGHTHADVLRVLGRYPEVATGVVDEIAALVPRYEGGHAWAAIAVLGELGPAAGEVAVRALRDEVTRGDHPSVAVYAAEAHHRVGGDPALALSALDREGPERFPELTARLGAAGAPLLPRLEPLLAPGHPAGTRAAVARAVWRITGRIEDTVEPLARRAAAADAHHTERLASVTALTETGLLPRFALTSLRATAEAPGRAVHDLSAGSGPHPDYRLRSAVRTLLATAHVVD